ncbi:MAG: radical SAM family heme chaperone HemW, partial [Clostridia bacterium]|nr:radical SAM family heme chaperone HemW [Clostridia bacterium]
MYCDFCSAAEPLDTIAAYCDALRKEIRLMAGRYRDAKISTVFLGGGTPSLVPADVMAGVLDELHHSFDILPDAEFTSEANPGTLTGEWLDMALARGMNRLSLGVQAAQDHLLQKIGRIHSAEDAETAVKLARRHGVKNLNLDAMFGLPGQTEKDYLDTLAAFRQLGAEHISAYSLILEEDTPLYRLVNAGHAELPDEDETAAMYEHGIDWLEKAGYHRYEVSNFARSGFECRHNIGYWQGEWYLGLGVAAHSMLPTAQEGMFCQRKGNAADVKAYIHALQSGQEAPVDGVDLIGKDEAMFEAMMLGLRT